jgi:hypothetical protein
MLLPNQQILRLLLLCLTLLGLGGTSCAVLEVGLVQTPTPNYSHTSTVAALSTQNAQLAVILREAAQRVPGETPSAPPLSPTPGPSPTITPTPEPPGFSNVRFSTQPEAIRPRQFYVAGIPRLYAVWDYRNMREGMVVQRIWRHNGDVWLTREENWNYNLLGANGTLQGISIFDLEDGLPPGHYTLSLFINGEQQDLEDAPGEQEAASFWLYPSDVPDPVISPDRQRTARVQNGNILTIQEPNGEVNTLAIAQEISGVSWFPDSRTLLYTERDRSDQEAFDRDAGITHKLWRVDVISGERLLLAGAGENFHSPLISPSGRLLAAQAGSTEEDRVSCRLSPTLVILELDTEFRRSAVYTLENFTNLAEASEAAPDLESGEMSWDAEERLTLPLRWACPDSAPPPDGVYRLNLRTLQAVRLE